MSAKRKKRGPYRANINCDVDDELHPPTKKLRRPDEKICHETVMNKLRESLLSRSKDKKVNGYSKSDSSTETHFQQECQNSTNTNMQEDPGELFAAHELNIRIQEDSEMNIPPEEEFKNIEPEDFFFECSEDLNNSEEIPKVDKDEIPLFPGSNVNVGTFMLLMALFVSKHNLVGDAVEQLLKIFSYVLPDGNNVTTSLYSFKSYFKTLRNNLEYHYYCPKCLSYVNDKSELTCKFQSCRQSFQGQKLPYFIEIAVIEQLRSLFLQEGFFHSLQGRFNRGTSPTSDIYDGQIYQQLFCSNGPLSQPENVSFVLNTDGAPVFKSSGVSIWPLFLTINELEIRQRMLPENMVLAGLWFGSVKPVMCTFLKPFISCMKKLYSGVQFFSPERGFFNCKAFLLAATADLPAKAMLCNSVQYNGSYGCWHCLQKGVTAARGKGHVHVFPFKEEMPKGPLRSMEGVIKDAQAVLDSRKVNFTLNGVKGPSWLSFCPKFDLVYGLSIDYMHGILLGVQKLLLRLWFAKEFSSEVFSFSKLLPKVDVRLTNIHPTLDITRLPRSIQDEIKYWKASEFQNFLLFYSLPILSDILDTERFLHFSLLVDAVYILLQSTITEEDISRADFMLIKFCQKFGELYDQSFMTLNIHQLVHLADHVRNIGPLYTNSCFPFENKNGMILKMIKGTQNIEQQIATGVSFIQKLPELKQKFVQKDSPLQQLCNLIEYPHVLKRGAKLMENTYILGGVSARNLNDKEFQCLSYYLGKAPTQGTFHSFHRLELNGHLVYSVEYSRMLKRDNSFIQYRYKDSMFYGQVCFFILFENRSSAVAAVNCYECIENDLPVSHIVHVRNTANLAIVPIKNIVGVNLVVNIKEKGIYICNFPNKFDFL